MPLLTNEPPQAEVRTPNPVSIPAALNLKAGEWVEVRSQAEILATLDENGRLENVPFMPEMLQYCGRRFVVYKRAHKTCDNIKDWSLRRVSNAVHLTGVRCDGSAHASCDAGCMIFWKEAWLRRISPEIVAGSDIGSAGLNAEKSYSLTQPSGPGCTLEALWKATHAAESGASGEELFACQATDLRKFTSDLPWWNLRQYVWDIRSGNLNRGMAGSKSEQLLETLLAVLDVSRTLLIAIFNKLQRTRNGVQYPYIEGTLAATSTESLNLQTGEFVTVKSRDEILATLDRRHRNRGLLFDSEMVRYCGGTFRVLKKVNQIVDEKTGKIIRMKSSCIILEGVSCVSEFHRLCPRAIYHYWREDWLRRVQ